MADMTDDEILDLWSGPGNRPTMGRNKVIGFARAVLAAQSAADNAELRAERGAIEEQAVKNADEVLALRAERDALRVDAERYRWLRDVHAHHYTVTRVVGGALIPRLDGPRLDAAIDAARKAAP